MREVIRLHKAETGIVTDNVITFHLTPRAHAADYYAIEQRVAQLPGVLAAGFIQLVPLQNWGWDGGFSIAGRPPSRDVHGGFATSRPDFSATLGIPVLRGRASTTRDTARRRGRVCERGAGRRYLRREDPVGRELRSRHHCRRRRRRAAGRPRSSGRSRSSSTPLAQNVAMTSDIGMSLVVRTAGPARAARGSSAGACASVNPRLAIFNVKTMDRSCHGFALGAEPVSLADRTVRRAGAAAGRDRPLRRDVLHATSRMREFAVRLALGSAPVHLARLVFVDAVRLAAAGLAIGLLIAFAVAPLFARCRPT